MVVQKPHTSQVKLSSFYGDVARPYLVFKDGQVIEDRVDKPSANAPLLSWAKQVPFSAGGALQKPEPPAGVTLPPKARTEMAIFIDARRADILAANPSLMADPDSAAFRVAASIFWKESLTDDERSSFREAAEKERTAEKEATEALAVSNPAFAEYLQKEKAFKKAKGGIMSAHRIAAGPLWKAAAAKQRAEGGAAGSRRRHAKVPEELKMKMRKTRTKHYEVRSKQYARKLAAKRAAERAEEEEDAAEEAAEEAAAAADVAFDIEIEISEASESDSETSESESEFEEESEEEEEEEEAPAPVAAKKGGRKRLAGAASPAPATAAKKAKKGGASAGKAAGKAAAAALKKKGYTDEFELPELAEDKRVTRGAAAAGKPAKKAAVKAKAPARKDRRKGAAPTKILAC